MNLLKINTANLKQQYPLSNKKDINLTDLYELYKNQNLTSPTIAIFMGTTKGIIDVRCKRLGLTKTKQEQKMARENTCLIKYGVKSVKQFKATSDKYKKTCLEKYGVDNISKITKRLQELSDYSKIHGFKNDETNPGYKHGGKLSSLSTKFIKYQNNDRVTINKNIEQVKLKISKSLKSSDNLSNKKEYWMKKGYTENEAIQKVSERQTTFSKEICIKKYGEVNGLERWADRQKKWLKTLNSKSPTEIERINRAKMTFSGYSKISQKLFWNLYERIKSDYLKIYFATLDKITKTYTDKNNEYMIFANNKNNKNGCFFLDFFIKDTGKIIEFDGDYWHSEKRGNVERDKVRDKQILKIGYKILHIRERDFNNNTEEAIKECLEFIYE